MHKLIKFNFSIASYFCFIILLFASSTKISNAQTEVQTGSHTFTSSQIAEFTVAAEQGNADTQFLLYMLYGKGNGVKKDIEKATYWLRKAAKNRHIKAQHNLGLAYQRGTPFLTKNDGQALFWFEKAANAGYLPSQSHLGVMYTSGHGVKQDKKQGFFWNLKAANRGDQRAQVNIGLQYLRGLGVERDVVKAYKWLGMVNYTKGSKVERYHNAARDQMTQEQINEAEKLLNEWRSQQRHWQTITYEKVGESLARFHIDSGTLKQNGEKYSADILLSFYVPVHIPELPGNKSYASMIWKVDAYCRNRKLDINSTEFFSGVMASGNVLLKSEEKERIKNIPPESAMGALFKHICHSR